MSMKPRVSLITLGVHDLARARHFYEIGLGWKVSNAGNEHVAFIQLAGGVVLGLFSRKSLAEDAHLSHIGSGFSGITLAQNLESKEAVDHAMAKALTAGAKLLKKPQDVFWGGYSGYFSDPEDHIWELAWNPFFPLSADGGVTLT